MNSIVNMFNVLDNSVENNKNKNYENVNNLISTPALNQGTNFKNYQNKIKNNLRKNINYVNNKEGFQNSSSSSSDTPNQLAEQSKQILSETSSGTDNSLQKEYNIILKLYEKKLAEVSGGTTDFINRVNPSNPYLNKYIHWTDSNANGLIMYVTNQGVAKPITDSDIYTGILGKNGCPNDKSMVDITIPWDSSYNIEGTTIPTSPSLIVGTPMKANQSCGNEGLNVYVDKLITNSKTNYIGCYVNNSMTFIGGAPSDNSDGFITNGNFSQSQIANDSYKYLTWDSTTIPGWNFNCVLLNNSSAWGYPMPYPNGNQCACIQNTQELWTANWMSFSSGVTYTITFDACGRNCCDGSGSANPIEIRVEGGNPFYTFTPPIDKWTKYSTTFNVDVEQSKRIWFRGTWTDGDRSSALQNIVINKGDTTDTTSGTYTFNKCKQAAIDGGYKYFGLQNVNTKTSKGYCGVSNDSVGVVQKGTAYAVSGGVALWDTKTNNSGTSASLTNQGALTVYDSSGTAVFNTDNSTAQPSDYLGCYIDNSKRAMPYLQEGNMDYAACKKKATDNGAAPYFGLQNSTSGTNAECWLSSSIDGIRDYGKATNCTKISDGTYSGGGWSNAIYSLDPVSIYYLILQDNGNMSIHRGKGPSDNQGKIWSSETKGKQQKPNPAYTAAKGKYGKNWVSSGSALSAGDFIGSPDGSIYLIMQADGNLVLYTSNNSENCQKMKNKKFGGGEGANALYELAEIGIPENLAKIGYVDSNSLLSIYGDSNIEQTKNGEQPKLKNLPVGISNKIINIDSVAFENYPKTDNINNSFSLTNANSAQRQELDQLKTRLDQISQELADNTGNLNADEIKVGNQSTLQTQSIGNYLKDYKNTNNKIKKFNSGMEGIIHDSDINVLKENYNYYFWSILAVGTVLVTMNIAKN
jgi:hypothetical protein